jgi:hypothetical protein
MGFSERKDWYEEEWGLSDGRGEVKYCNKHTHTSVSFAVFKRPAKPSQ